MAGPKPSTEQARAEAARLYAEARSLEARHEHHAARVAYEASLRLYEDEDVAAAYRGLLAKIGPV